MSTFWKTLTMDPELRLVLLGYSNREISECFLEHNDCGSRASSCSTLSNRETSEYFLEQFDCGSRASSCSTLSNREISEYFLEQFDCGSRASVKGVLRLSLPYLSNERM